MERLMPSELTIWPYCEGAVGPAARTPCDQVRCTESPLLEWFPATQKAVKARLSRTPRHMDAASTEHFCASGSCHRAEHPRSPEVSSSSLTTSTSDVSTASGPLCGQAQPGSGETGDVFDLGDAVMERRLELHQLSVSVEVAFD